jgi:adenylate kinase
VAYLPEGITKNRRVVILGIPGVGKSTVVDKIVERLRDRNIPVRVVNYGTLMLQVASERYDVKSRDEIRKLPLNAQRELQINSATEISKMSDNFVIVDTHLFIATSEGFWPGMPMNVLGALNPTNLVLVTATPGEILRRRAKDTTRKRDKATKESLEQELSIARILLFASGIVCGCPSLIVPNVEGKLDITVEKIISALV